MVAADGLTDTETRGRGELGTTVIGIGELGTVVSLIVTFTRRVVLPGMFPAVTETVCREKEFKAHRSLVRDQVYVAHDGHERVPHWG